MVIGMDPGNIVNVYAVTFGKDRWRPYMEAYEMYYNQCLKNYKGDLDTTIVK